MHFPFRSTRIKPRHEFAEWEAKMAPNALAPLMDSGGHPSAFKIVPRRAMKATSEIDGTALGDLRDFADPFFRVHG